MVGRRDDEFILDKVTYNEELIEGNKNSLRDIMSKKTLKFLSDVNSNSLTDG